MAADFLEKYKILVGLTELYPSFKELLSLDEMQVPEAEVAGFEAEKKISKEHQQAIKLVAAATGAKYPHGEYWRSAARVAFGEGAIYVGMGASFLPRPGTLNVSWFGDPAWTDPKNQDGVDAMESVLKAMEPHLKKFGEITRRYDNHAQFMHLQVEMSVAMVDEYLGALDSLAKRFGNLVAKAVQDSSGMDLEAIDPSDVELVVAESVKDVEEGRTVLPGTTRRRKDGMYKMSNDGRWLKVKTSNKRLKAGQAKWAAQRAAFRAAYPGGHSESVCDRMRMLLAEGDVDLVRVIKTLKAGDKVEISYNDPQKGGATSTVREVLYSWEDLQRNHPGSFKTPEVMIKAKVKGKLKDGMIRDYGDGRVMWQPTMATQVADVTGLKKV